MTKKDNYVLVTWYSDHGYNWDDFVTSFEFVTDKQLDDIKGLMKANGVKRWVKNPHLMTEAKYKLGDASLLEFRNLEVRPIKIVEAWGYSREKIND